MKRGEGLIDSRFHPLLIIVIGVVIYSNTFNAPFVFDDLLYITKNPAVMDLDYFVHPSEARKVIGPDSLVSYTFNSRLMGYLTFAVNYRIHGYAVAGYHIVNVLIHIFNALLVYRLILLTLKSIRPSAPGVQQSSHSPFYIALFASLVFVSHPVQTQAVTYISQRFASFATMFYLLSIVLYVKFRIQDMEFRARNTEEGLSLKSVFWYLCSVFSAVLAMKTKETAFTLPIVIALYEFIFFREGLKRRIIYLAPILLTMFIIPASVMNAGASPEGLSVIDEATRAKSAMSRLDYLFTEFRVIVTYVRLIFFPVSQNLDYDYPVYTSFFTPPVFLSLLLLVSIIGAAVCLLYKSRIDAGSRFADSPAPAGRPIQQFTRLSLISFGIFWFFITLSVESSIIPTQDLIFEHRLYLPSIGIIVSAVALIFHLADGRRLFSARTGALGLLIAVGVLSGAAYARNAVWKDDIALWQDVIRKSPGKARPYHELGLVYHGRGMRNEAASVLETAVMINPAYELAYRNLGVVYYELGRYDEAIRELQAALMLKKTGDAGLYANIGALYLKQGQTDAAVDYLERALSLNPDNASAHHNLGIAYELKGREDKAMEHSGKARSLDPEKYPDG